MKTEILDMIVKAKSYKKLVELYPPRIIESEHAYDDSLKIVERMMEVASLSKDQVAYLDLLSELVESYEESQLSIGSPSLSELLGHLIESRGLPKSQIAKESGVSATLISDVQAGRRALSLEAIRKLAAYFGVDASLFVAVS
jgi:HTH-type transcriptional regulator/antitoxin HigA